MYTTIFDLKEIRIESLLLYSLIPTKEVMDKICLTSKLKMFAQH